MKTKLIFTTVFSLEKTQINQEIRVIATRLKDLNFKCLGSLVPLKRGTDITCCGQLQPDSCLKNLSVTPVRKFQLPSSVTVRNEFRGPPRVDF
jgi:hypothetical protein